MPADDVVSCELVAPEAAGLETPELDAFVEAPALETADATEPAALVTVDVAGAMACDTVDMAGAVA